MTSRAHVRAWERLAKRDAPGAVLTPYTGLGRSADALDAFRATGAADVAHVMAILAGLGQPTHFERALDFGCGLGRLTWALARHADAVVGVDVAAPMLEGARALTTDPRIEFRLLDPGRAITADERFGLVLSLITLQHLARCEIEGALTALAGLVALGGALHFNLPDDRTPVWRRRLQDGLPDAVFYRLRPMKMRGLPQHRVASLLQASGLEVADVRMEATGALRYTALATGFDQLQGM